MELLVAINAFISELQDIKEIRRVPDKPPEKNEQFPFAVVYPLIGNYDTGPPGEMKGHHEINIELHVARKDLPRDYSTVMNIIDKIPKKLYQGILDTSKFNGFTFGGSPPEGIDYIFGPLEWAGIETLGVTYTIHKVKVTMDIT